MKTIKLNKINIQNFKGIAVFSYQFNGENATFISQSGVDFCMKILFLTRGVL